MISFFLYIEMDPDTHACRIQICLDIARRRYAELQKERKKRGSYMLYKECKEQQQHISQLKLKLWNFVYAAMTPEQSLEFCERASRRVRFNI
jgi:hypothetical protein